MPIFSITRRERVFHSAVNETSDAKAEPRERVVDRRRARLRWRSRFPMMRGQSRQPISIGRREGSRETSTVGEPDEADEARPSLFSSAA